jgi:MFS family permease
LTLCAYWFGFSFHWFFLLPILMPADVERLVGSANKGTYLGILQGFAAVIPLVLPPFLGMLSDRLGKRMSFLAGGTILNVFGLLVMMFSPSYVIYFAGYLLVQLGNAIAASPYTALIPDVVPVNERGRASGVMGFFQLFSQIAGGVVAFTLGGSRDGQYIAIIVVLSISAAITYFTTREPAKKLHLEEKTNWMVFFQPEYRDFRWVFLTRAFTETGKYAVQPFLAFFLADVIGVFKIGSLEIKGAELALTLLLVMLVTAAVTAVVSGGLSDRIGKKPVVMFAGLFMAVSALGFGLVKIYPLAILMGLLFGLGYGAFVSVDWALGTSVLPDERRHARDMGVWHIAMVFPQLFQGLFGFILDSSNKASQNSGYLILFLIAVTFFVLGSVFVSRVRTVK